MSISSMPLARFPDETFGVVMGPWWFGIVQRFLVLNTLIGFGTWIVLVFSRACRLAYSPSNIILACRIEIAIMGFIEYSLTTRRH